VFRRTATRWRVEFLIEKDQAYIPLYWEKTLMDGLNIFFLGKEEWVPLFPYTHLLGIDMK
jgi:hypothetical protein